MKLNENLAHYATQAIQAREKAVHVCDSLRNDATLAPDYRLNTMKDAYEKVRTEIERLQIAGADLIESAIETVNADEMKEARLRSLDTEYQQRLNAKIGTLERLVKTTISAEGKVFTERLDNATKAQIQLYLEEFEGDPVAIRMITDIIRPLNDIWKLEVVPKPYGEKQLHLKAIGMLNRNILHEICELLPDPFNLQGYHSSISQKEHTAFLDSVEAAYISYCKAQNEDFTEDDEAILESLKKIPEEGAEETPEDHTANLGYDAILMKLGQYMNMLKVQEG